MAKKKKKKNGRKCTILAIVQKYDFNRYRPRTVRPKKGGGRKDRPRDNSSNSYDDSFDRCA